MRLLRRLAWRVAAGIGVVWGTATLIFVAINLVPGDPAITVLGGPEALPSAAALAQARAEYGFDQPLYQQYWLYVSRLAQGDLGESLRLHLPVAQLIREQAGATAALAGTAILLAGTISPLVALATARRSRWLGTLLNGVEVTASLVPAFVVGLLLLLIFSFSARLLPSSSTRGWASIVLPGITLALPLCGVLIQVLRRELEEILEQPFIVTARARRMTEAAVRFRHAFRHALIPALTVSGMLFTSLLSSAVVVETVFNRQGLGRLMTDAAFNRDIPLVLGVALFAAAINVIVNVAVDLLYDIVDPRMRSS